MSQIPSDLKYTAEHEWVKVLDDGTALIGITDYAQSSLGDVTFVEMPDLDDSFESGDTFGVVESVKAASDLFMPIAGTIVETNADLDSSPELINESPYEKAWIIKIKIADTSALDALLTPQAYAEITG